MRVLYCTDGSEPGLSAAYAAKNNLKDCIIDIICVIDWSFLPANISNDDKIAVNAYGSVAEGILNTVAKRFEEIGLKVGEKIKEKGSPVDKIIAQSNKKDYALILMGSNGKHGIKKWLGSVSYQVAYNAELPLYVTKRTNEYKKILFAVDGSEQNFQSLEKALSLLDLQNKKIFVCSVLEENELLFVERTIDPTWISRVEEQRKIFLENSMESVEILLNKYDLNTDLNELLSGNPAEMIIDYTRQQEIDLVVLGSKTKTKISTLLLGSVSRRVLEHTLSDCLIMKEAKP